MTMKCGKFNKIYSYEEFVNLLRTQAVEKDINPEKKDIYVGICECGYRFGLDRWQLRDTVSIANGKEIISVDVSTVDLELSHGFNRDNFYESTLFSNEDLSEFCKRYKTQEEAIKGHNEILEWLKSGKYRIETGEDNKKRLLISAED